MVLLFSHFLGTQPCPVMVFPHYPFTLFIIALFKYKKERKKKKIMYAVCFDFAVFVWPFLPIEFPLSAQQVCDTSLLTVGRCWWECGCCQDREKISLCFAWYFSFIYIWESNIYLFYHHHMISYVNHVLYTIPGHIATKMGETDKNVLIMSSLTLYSGEEKLSQKN